MAKTVPAYLEKPDTWGRIGEITRRATRECERGNELSEVGQLVFRPICSQCNWCGEAFTAVEALAQAQHHVATEDHRPVEIIFDLLSNHLMNVE